MDAHADFNTEKTTPSGNIHGMPLSALCGLGDARLTRLWEEAPVAVDPRRVAVVGARDLDAGEKANLREAGVMVMGMEQIDRLGMTGAVEKAIERVSEDVDGIYLSFDMDALDPRHAPGVGTPVAAGLTQREGHVAFELIGETGRLIGMDIVEVNPDPGRAEPDCLPGGGTCPVGAGQAHLGRPVTGFEGRNRKSMQPTLVEIEELARQAGEIVREGFDRQHTISYKGVIDLVTEVDHASEDFLLGEIRRRWPGSTIMSEESGLTQGSTRRSWYVDPLDGTVNYAHQVPIFSVSIAYAEAGRVKLGAVYDPMRD